MTITDPSRAWGAALTTAHATPGAPHLDAGPPLRESGADRDARLNAEAVARARKELADEAAAELANAAAAAMVDPGHGDEADLVARAEAEQSAARLAREANRVAHRDVHSVYEAVEPEYETPSHIARILRKLGKRVPA
jgi:hypothetical protein